MKRVVGLVVALIAVAGLVAFLVLMGSLIYPGAMEWTAGSVCPADQQDTLVVRDTYQTEPGETSTNFTLYCIGARGQFTDAGFAEPLAILIAWAVAGAWVVVLAVWLFGTVRRLVRGGGGGPDDAEPASGPIGAAPPVEDYGGQPPLIT